MRRDIKDSIFAFGTFAKLPVREYNQAEEAVCSLCEGFERKGKSMKVFGV